MAILCGGRMSDEGFCNGSDFKLVMVEMIVIERGGFDDEDEEGFGFKEEGGFAIGVLRRR